MSVLTATATTAPQPIFDRYGSAPLTVKFCPHRFSRPSTSLTLASLRNPCILSHLISHLDWADFYSLSNACNYLRSLINDLTLRDVILSRFVPGYTFAMHIRDPFHRYKDVDVSLHDLDLLLISQRVPLHRYPAHALQALTASFPIKELADYTNRYMSLCQAHSRFVLLLQSYVHSSNDTVVGEPDDGSWNVQTTVGRQLRELIFPAPLSNAEDESPVIGETSQRLLKMTSPNSVTRYPTPSGTSHSSFSKKSTTFPLFRNSSLRLRSSFSNPVPPPKPTSELHAMKMYPSAWRRSSMRHSLRLNSGYMSDDDAVHAYVSRQLARQSLPKYFSYDSFHDTSSTSSIPSRSRHSVGGNSSAPPTLPPLLFRSASPVSASGALPVRIASHHDLNLAVTRTRAPVLRTFAPCSSLEDDSTGVLICEQQLIDAGLWDHLSAGDIVCNLGYVPPAGPTSHLGTPSSNNRIATDQRQYSRSNSGYYQHSFDKCQPSFSRKWLMFNGQYLVPFTPPEPVRLSEPLTLPSPLYYSHIMPPGTNPVFALDHSAFEDMVQNVTPEMRLMKTTIRVQSPHSPSGYALVKKHAWTMRLLRTQTIPSSETCQSSQCLGDGWLGEWILEGEGTKEGKQTLIDCVCGRTVHQMQWEVVRDRTGGGRIWLRLLNFTLSRATRLNPLIDSHYLQRDV